MLGLLPTYGGLVRKHSTLVAYGLLMLHGAARKFFLLWRTLTFSVNASFDSLAEQDELLAAFVQAEQS